MGISRLSSHRSVFAIVRHYRTKRGGPDNLIIGQKVTLASGSTRNVFVGELAGATAANSRSTTSDNTAVGYNSMAALTSGQNNAALGSNALIAITTGQANTAVGSNPLSHMTTGNSNTAFGQIVGGFLTTGSQNVLIGVSAGVDITTGFIQHGSR